MCLDVSVNGYYATRVYDASCAGGINNTCGMEDIQNIAHNENLTINNSLYINNKGNTTKAQDCVIGVTNQHLYAWQNATIVDSNDGNFCRDSSGNAQYCSKTCGCRR